MHQSLELNIKHSISSRPRSGGGRIANSASWEVSNITLWRRKGMFMQAKCWACEWGGRRPQTASSGAMQMRQNVYISYSWHLSYARIRNELTKDQCYKRRPKRLWPSINCSLQVRSTILDFPHFLWLAASTSFNNSNFDFENWANFGSWNSKRKVVECNAYHMESSKYIHTCC